MGHFFSRAIKRLTFGGGGGANSSSGSSKSASRNQLPDNEQQEPHGQSSTSQRESDSNRPIVQAIPVGQSIDSAEYAAFENASSSPLPKADHGQTSKQKTPPPATIHEEDEEQEKENNKTSDEAADQNTQPLVEEAVIKIQALVRGHLTRKALKDAQQQAASPAPNALGQRQFDEESLIKNPPSAIFLPTSPLSSNSPTQEASNSSGSLQQQQQQQQLNKHHANPRVPPLESIAEDEVDETQATTNQNQEAAAPLAAISEEGQRRRLSSARRSSGNADASQSSIDATTPSSPQPPSTANVSIDIHCDTPASSVSIDIVDHTSVGPLGFGLASVLYPQHRMTVSEHQPSQETGNIATNDGELQRVGDDEVNILPDISGIPSNRVSAVTAFENNSAAAAAAAAAMDTASSLPASPPHINLAAATTNSHSIDSAEAAAIRIQSAFRGYHTRKHSPYRRRRSPVANSASVPQTNGYSDHHHAQSMMNGVSDRARRNLLLRQQDATATEEEEELDVEEEDEGVEGGRLMAEDLANTVLSDEDEDEEENDNQRLAVGELESDDIERRDPSGSRVGEEHDKSPRIGNIDSFEHEQPALVSSSSLDDDQQPSQEHEEQNNERLEVVSPDEAIGSGRSSPALASDNSSDDEEHGAGDESPQLQPETSGQQQQQSGGGNKNKKRNRNKRKGKK